MSSDVINAAYKADWGQVVCNGGPPCFHQSEGSFCLRARRWGGHDAMHKFVPLHELLEAQDAEITRLRESNAALLAALGELVAWATKYPPHRVYGYADIQRISAELEVVVAAARAAIEGAK